MPELRIAWGREKEENKERVIAQFKEPITKNCQLNTYEATQSYSGGYESDFTANTQNSEGIFAFQAETEFDTSASVNSNGEIEGIPPSSELTVNAAASSKSILQNKQPSRRTI